MTISSKETKHYALATCLAIGMLLTAELRAESPPLRFNVLYASGSMGEQYSRHYLLNLCARIKRPCELLVLPGKRAIAMMESGQLDGEIGRLDRFIDITSAKSYLKIRPSYIERHLLIASRSNDPHPIKTLEDLSRHPTRVGYPRGYAYFQSLAERHPSASPIPLNSSDQCFALLTIQRVDACIYDDLEISADSYRMLRSGALRSTPSLESTPANLYLHQQHHAMLKTIEQAAQDLRASGADKKLQRQYLLSRLDLRTKTTESGVP